MYLFPRTTLALYAVVAAIVLFGLAVTVAPAFGCDGYVQQQVLLQQQYVAPVVAAQVVQPVYAVQQVALPVVQKQVVAQQVYGAAVVQQQVAAPVVLRQRAPIVRRPAVVAPGVRLRVRF